jgi:hypothetical protein
MMKAFGFVPKAFVFLMMKAFSYQRLLFFYAVSLRRAAPSCACGLHGVIHVGHLTVSA